MTGAVCGRYHLGPQIGAGGLGRVYAAQERPGSEVVALKISSRRPVSTPTARILQRLAHPNVVRVLGHGTCDGGCSYIVMERLPGVPLGTHIKREGALAFSRVLHVGMQLLSGLEALHLANVVHGDVKSDNLMVDVEADDRATLIDLGFEPPPQGSHMFTGTPEYIAPEVILGDAPMVASDVYGAAIVLYEMVTATTPFAGGTSDEIFDRQLAEPAPLMSAMCPERGIPPELESLIARALAKDPAARPRGALAFARELKHALPPEYEGTATRLPRFTTSGPTQDWKRPTFSDTESAHVR